MAEIGTIAVRLQALTAEFNRKMSRSAKSVDSIGEAAAKVAKVSAVAFGAMAAGMAFVTIEASKQRKAEDALGAAIKAANLEFDSTNILAYATALQKVTTFGDDVTIVGASVLASFQLEEQAILDLLPLVQDLAAFNNTDMRSSALQVGKAFATSAGALSRMGVVMDDTTKKAFDLAEGAERAAILVDVLRANVGGAAVALANNAVGAFLQLGNSVGDTAEQFGYMIDSPIKEFFVSIRDVVDRVNAGLEGLSDATKTTMGEIALGTLAVVGFVGALASVIALSGPLLAMFAAIGSAAAIAFGTILPIVLGVAAAIAVVVLLVGVGSLAWKAWGGTVTKSVAGAYTSVVNFVKAMVETFLDGFKLIGKMFNTYFGSISDSAIQLMGMLKGMSPEEVYAIQQAAGSDSLFETDGTPFQAFVDKLTKTGDEILEKGAAAGDIIADGATAAWGGIAAAFGEGADLIGGAIDGLIDQLGGLIPGAAPIAKSKGGGKGKGGGGGGRRVKSSLAGPAMPSPVLGASAIDRPIASVGNTLKGLALDLERTVREGSATFGQMFGNSMLSAAGDLGDLVNSGIQGFQQGGPFGALAAVMADLVSRSDAFRNTVAHGNRAMEDLVDAFEPLAEAMQPLAGLTHNLISAIAGQLKPVFEALTPVFTALFEVMKWSAIVIANIVRAIGMAWNLLIQTISGVFTLLANIEVFGKKPLGFLSDWADTINRATINMNGLDRIISDLHQTTADSLRDEIDAAAAAKETAETFRALNQEMKNTPSGFKTNLRAFQATSAPAADNSKEGFGGKRTANFYIQAHSIEETEQKLREYQDFRDFVAGARTPMRTPFAIPQGGG